MARMTIKYFIFVWILGSKVSSVLLWMKNNISNSKFFSIWGVKFVDGSAASFSLRNEKLAKNRD